MEDIGSGVAFEDRRWAYALLRVLLGMNIAVHGLARIHAGVGAFAAEMVPQFAKTPLPAGLVRAYGMGLPFAEALVGLAVLLGAGTRWALILGALLMVSLTFGSALAQNWTAAGWQLLYGLVYAALLAFRGYNWLAVDPLRRAR